MSSGEAGQIPVDVICQQNTDGRIIPLRFRMKDEDGEYHTYTIREYKELSHMEVYTNPDGLDVHSDVCEFECEITVFKRKRRLRLFYRNSAHTSKWSVCL